MTSTVAAAISFSALVVIASGQQSSSALRPCSGADGTAPSSAIRSGDFIELRRTACFGSCPIYTVRLYGDGRITWHGEKFVSMIGDTNGQVAADQAASILEGARKNAFWALCNGYTASVTDQPTTVTTLSIDNKIKSVSEYGHTAPPWLHDLDKRIDTFTDKNGWRTMASAPAW